MPISLRAHEDPRAGPVVTKAVVRAADHLGLSSKVMALTLGVSEATVSRMRTGGYVLAPGTKSFELAVLLVRLFRSLDALVGGDEVALRGWLASDHRVLNGRPVDQIQSVTGLLNVIGYLDARRALV